MMANPNRHELIALAERWERAQAPDRELDADTAVALNIGARGVLPDDHEYLSRIRKDDGCAPGTYWFHCRSGKSLRTALTYTASLDAVRTIIPSPEEYPDSKTYLIDCATQTSVYGQPVAYVWSDTGKHMGKGWTDIGALGAAALRAHAEMAPQ